MFTRTLILSFRLKLETCNALAYEKCFTLDKSVGMNKLFADMYVSTQREKKSIAKNNPSVSRYQSTYVLFLWKIDTTNTCCIYFHSREMLTREDVEVQTSSLRIYKDHKPTNSCCSSKI
jgi:hypothetical protein